MIRDIKRECAGADFLYEMEVKFDSSGGDHLETSETDIDAWAESVADFIKEENA